MRALPLHLDAGSDLHHSLRALAAQEGIDGFVLSVVGNLSQAAFQCPGGSQPTMLQGDLEVITLQGTLSPHGVHLHLSLSDGQCQVWGGHLEPGTIVQKGVDLLVGVLDRSAGPTSASPAVAPPASPAAASPASPPARLPLINAEARLQILVREGCPWCRRALRLLQSHGIPLDRHEASQPGPVPQVWLDGEWIGGYDALVDLQVQGRLQQLRQR